MVRWKKLGIIAGGGDLPVRIAASCRAQNKPFHIIRLTGSVDKSLDDLPGDDFAIGEAGKILRTLKNENCDAVVFAGVVRRPNFKTLKADWRGAAMLPKVIAAAARGDGALLTALVEVVESEGMFVIGAEEATADLAAPAGVLGKHSPSEDDMLDIRKAASVINALGAYDIGQAAIVAKGLVLAVEAVEGTDEMLSRCASLPFDLRNDEVCGVLVKRPKPGQELRVDLPVIGPETVKRAHKAKLSGIAVEAGVALIIDRENVTALANELGLFVYGFTETDIRTS